MLVITRGSNIMNQPSPINIDQWNGAPEFQTQIPRTPSAAVVFQSKELKASLDALPDRNVEGWRKADSNRIWTQATKYIRKFTVHPGMIYGFDFFFNIHPAKNRAYMYNMSSLAWKLEFGNVNINTVSISFITFEWWLMGRKYGCLSHCHLPDQPEPPGLFATAVFFYRFWNIAM